MENAPDIKYQLTSQEIFEAFKSQLKKDFEQSTFSISFIEGLEADYATIHKKIVIELHNIEARTDFNTMHLLNRIDISEAQLKRHLAENKNKTHFSIVADLIIKRVLQKVVIKQFYKNKENL